MKVSVAVCFVLVAVVSSASIKYTTDCADGGGLVIGILLILANLFDSHSEF